MAVVTKTYQICDRCGFTVDMSTYGKGVCKTFGQLNLNWRGELGSNNWEGMGAQITIKDSGWLCETCAKDFLKFMENKNNEKILKDKCEAEEKNLVKKIDEAWRDCEDGLDR